MENQVVWRRPEGCVCTIQEIEGVFQLVTNSNCPVHGQIAGLLAYLETYLEDYLKSIPGGNKVTKPMLRRILSELVPVLIKDENIVKLMAYAEAEKAKPKDDTTTPQEQKGSVGKGL